ncbi:glutathione metabolism protein [Jiella endophytica]|uniref:Glutathione metabolism protein n=1 Tax=Jiella endophytica TaxID=2558362 RepID=A0A4Y8RCS6_9HYPH|nr:MAPEG family protein [Jiella endophytica]TFF19838.1 glutathione metabolism protein [Jiella endophytica]
MPIAALYAAILTPVFLALSVRVVLRRNSLATIIGDGGDAALRRRIRVHGNFCEYTPMGLILLALAESLATPAWALHVAGLALVAGRLLHAYGVSQLAEIIGWRIVGMAATFASLVVSAIACLIGAIG